MIPTLPASWSRDPARHPLERQRLFAKTWLAFGHADELPGPGRAVARTLAGFPLLVLRDGEGRLRAFHNVCRHRAGPLLGEEEAGPCEALSCRYHGWRYGLDGRLERAPGFGHLPDPARLSLLPVEVDLWRGLIFVRVLPGGPPLAGLVAGLPGDLVDALGPGLRLRGRARHELACDWKVYMENYLECYHIPTVHPGLDASLSAKDVRVEVGDTWVVQRAPVQSGENRGLWAWLWPNLALNVYEGGLSLERVQPLGPGRCAVEYHYLFEEGARAPEAARDMSEAVTLEDAGICEAVQRNLDAGVYEGGVLSPRQEPGVARFVALVTAALGG